MDILGLLFSFGGRIGRRTFFVTTSLILVFHAIVIVLLWRSGLSLLDLLTMRALLLGVAYLGLTGWINIALTNKRFHDFGRSGQTTTFFFMGPGIATVSMGHYNSSVGLMAIGLIQFPVVIYEMWLLLLLFFKRGDAAANAYGPPGDKDGPAPRAYSNADDDPSASQARAMAAIDAMAAKARATSSAPDPAGALLPAPASGLAPSGPPTGFGRRSGGFGRR